MELFWVNKKNLYVVFIDLEKHMIESKKNLIQTVLKVKKTKRLYIKLIKNMYINANTCVKVWLGTT